MPFRKKSMDALKRLSVDEYRLIEKMPVVMVLDHIRSANNVGAIFRSADAFRIAALYLVGYTPQPPHRDITKTAIGAEHSVVWHHASDMAGLAQQLRDEGYAMWAVEQAHESIPLDQWQLPAGKVALILGHEVDGVPEDTLTLVDGCIEIPQGGTKHSLNVATSAGIVMWEVFRQWRE